MQILNKNLIPYLSPAGVNWRDSSSIVDVKLKDDNSYFLIEFFDKHSLTHIIDIVKDDLKIKIKEKKIRILLSNTHEAFNDYVLSIYKILVFHLGIPESQILLLSEAADIDKEVFNVSSKLNREPISVEWTRVFELSMQQNIKFLNINHNTLSFKKYDKKFLNFNRRWRIHRPIFVSLLHSYNILDKGYVSLAKSDDNTSWNDILGTMLEETDNSEINKIISTHINEIKSIKPLYIDIKNLEENQVNLSNSSRNYYNNTYFSVVSETNFYKKYGSSPFLSEKTFKPIAEKHPFILLNRPGSLNKLKEIGYKTFSSVINEDYDNEEDDNKRLKMIVDEVIRLSNLSEKELNKFLHVCKRICNFNYELLKNKNTFSTKLI
jgi:hypothetical protein